jgi:hypothetical protein
VRRTRWWLVLVGLVALLGLPGCGGCGVERGKNSDLDRPKAPGQPAEKK